MTRWPKHADTIVVGGGTAGPVVAARLSERPGRSVLLLEAGPDYGPSTSGQWPPELLNPYEVPGTHDWGYLSAAPTGRPNIPLERARVLGGCSAHNGCAAVWGSRLDYDGWRDQGNPGWGAAELQPIFERVSRQMRLRPLTSDDVSPWHRACVQATQAAGVPWLPNFNDFDADEGVGLVPVNIYQRTRWNAAFAYLDDARLRPGLSIVGHTHVTRLRLSGSRVIGVEVRGPEGEGFIAADQVILCGGSYGSPAILLHSGLGPAAELRALGLEVAADLPGVGRNLHDHPAVFLRFAATVAAAAALEAFRARDGELFIIPLIAKQRSPHCAAAFDLHLFPMCWPVGPESGIASGWEVVLAVANVAPRARGAVTLANRDPATAPVIDTQFLNDPEGLDAASLSYGVSLARDWGRRPELAAWCAAELPDTAGLTDAAALRGASAHYFHPVGTCRMGPDPEAGAVVDAAGRVHGFDNLYVADASIMPTVPRANTNLPTLVVAEVIAAQLARAEVGC